MRWWSRALSPERESIVAVIDGLCDKFATPADIERWDRSLEYPSAAMGALAEGGWAGLAVPAEHGGTAASARDLVVVHQALGRRSLALAQAYYSLWVLGADAIDRLGNASQRSAWLPRIAAGEVQIAFALTEPDSGSDAAALRTTAARDGAEFVVTGQKVFITGAKVADRIITAVRTTNSDRKQQGISLLMIDPKAPGVVVRPLTKMGLRAIDLCEVFFDSVRVPATEVLGDLDQGWRQLRGGLARERLYLAALSLGALYDLIGLVLEHARERRAFGKPIGDHQMIGQQIVRLRVAADAGAGLVEQAADALDGGADDAEVAASVAKLFVTDAYVSATRVGVQVFGGYGFTEDYPVARHYRDCKYLEIGGGTSEIQTIVIGRSMGLAL
jgi:alkylation response protein AidB-like acyl-CoA dehydrogenase